jgi:cytochrome P450
MVTSLHHPFFTFYELSLSNTCSVLGELAFSESFGSVKNRKTASWVATILNQVKFLAYDGAVFRLSPTLWKWMPYFIPAEITKAGVDHVNNSKAKILHRMEKGDLARRDFSSYLFEKKDELKLNDWNLAAYAQVLIVAGSETSATTLSAMTYYLCTNPVVYQRLKDEVRSAFRSADDITSVKATLPYVNAVINESLRIYPPVPIGVSRIAPKNGAMVAGVFVPGGVGFSAVHP